MNKGKVYIMGVGPGDYKLATLKAVECIGSADVVVYDRLISTKLLSHARKDAELIYVGKMPDRHVVPQHQINRILVEKALEGKNVARVKGGDPFVFGRGGEEAEELRENGIEFEIVPGVTSSIAVPAYAGIPVTHRDFCSSFHIVTGHERAEKDESIIDYESLAKVEGTLIFLMGVKNLPEITANLIKHGKDRSTPAAVVHKGTTVEQQVVAGTVENIAQKVVEAGINSPSVTIIGKVVELREKLNWFPSGKLAGKKVVVTRAREQASKLVEKIESLGGEVIEFPTIKISQPADYVQFDKVLDSLGSYGWIVFTSVNGVDAFFERMKVRKLDIRALYSIKLCAVGEATAGRLNDIGFNVDFVPEKFTTSYLLEGLLERVKPGEKVLLARADIGSAELAEGLEEKGVAFDDLTVYRTVLDSADRDDLVNLIESGKIDYITFTSSSTVRNFISVTGKDMLDKINKIKVVCIGPVTAKTAEELGVRVADMAEVYTIDGLVEKLIEN